jgi:hypothetical protein
LYRPPSYRATLVQAPLVQGNPCTGPHRTGQPLYRPPSYRATLVQAPLVQGNPRTGCFCDQYLHRPCTHAGPQRNSGHSSCERALCSAQAGGQPPRHPDDRRCASGAYRSDAQDRADLGAGAVELARCLLWLATAADVSISFSWAITMLNNCFTASSLCVCVHSALRREHDESSENANDQTSVILVYLVQYPHKDWPAGTYTDYPAPR